MPRTPAAFAAVLAAGAILAPAADAADVTLRHKATKFAIKAPRGAKLSFSKGVYRVTTGALTISFSRSITTLTPSQFGTALLAQLKGRVVSRKATTSRFTAEVTVGSRRETVIATRKGTTMVVTTGSSPAKRPAKLTTISR